ncbi:MAG: hypothetical protein R2744_11180 [Bacteroidales bacterium]
MQFTISSRMETGLSSQPGSDSLYMISSDSIEVIDHSDKQSLVLLMERVGEKIFVGDNIEGLFEFRGDTLAQPPGGDFFSNRIIMCLIPGDEEGEVIVGSFFDGIVSYNYLTGEVNEEFVNPGLNEVLARSNVYKGLALSDSTFVIGTVSGGGVFIFNKDGKLLEQFDSDNSELLDNQVLSLFFDSDANYPILWITNYGFISKAYLGLPSRLSTWRQSIILLPAHCVSTRITSISQMTWVS